MRFTDVLDILLVGFLIFYLFRLLKGSQVMSIIFTVLALYAFRIIATALDMRLLAGILSMVLDVGVIALIILFQPEIRRFLVNLGNTYRKAGERIKWLPKFLLKRDEGQDAEVVNEISKAAEVMSSQKCGALIVIQNQMPLSFIIDTGDIVDAKVSERLLRNLFFKNSPLHDGAVIISGDRIVAARCTLPITQAEVPPYFGMRHKAAIGISEVTDARVVVVSEETGAICVVNEGSWHRVETMNDLKRMLRSE